MQKRFALVVAVLAVFSILVFSLIICAGLVEAANLIVYNNSAPTQTPYFVVNGTTGLTGIGTANPGQKLEVAGVGRFTGTRAFSIGDDAGYYRIQTYTAGGPVFRFLSSGNSYTGIGAANAIVGAGYTDTGTAPANGLLVEGNVGVGHANPNARLHLGSGNITLSGGWITNVSNPLVSTDVATKAYVDAATGGAGSTVWSRVSTGVIYPNTTSDNVSIGAGTVAQNKLTVNGNIGIINGSLWQPTYASDDGLVGYWSFSEGTGSTVYDNGPNGIDGTLTPGSNGFITTTGQMWNGGKYGNALRFDGNDSYVDIGDRMPELFNGTVELWFKRDSTGSSYEMLFTDGGSRLEITAVGTSIYFYVNNSAISAASTADGQWHHIAGTFDTLSSSRKLYLDGVLVATGSYSGSATAINRYIGSRAGSYPFNGTIDEVRVYSRALNSDEIRNQYLSGLQSDSVVRSNYFRVVNSSAQQVFTVNGSSGNVGIGTNNPSYTLDVNGTARWSATSQKQAFLVYNNASGNTGTVLKLGDNSIGLNSLAGAVQFTPQAGFGKAFSEVGGGWETNTSNGYLSFSTTMDATTLIERVRINNLGYVGIGTSNPISPLNVKTTNTDVYSGSNSATWDSSIILSQNAASTGYSNLINFQGPSNVNSVLGVTQAASGYGDLIFASYDGSFAERLRVTASGNVGIGTTSPNSILDVRSAGAIFRLNTTASVGSVYADFTNAVGDLYIGRDSATGGSFGSANASLVYSTGAYPLEFWTNSQRRVTIASDGNVGIGTTTPSRALDVRGVGNFSGTVYINNGTDVNALISSSDDWNVSGSNLFPLSTAYNVGIGTTSPTEKLQVQGGLLVTANDSANYQAKQFVIYRNVGTTAGSTTQIGNFSGGAGATFIEIEHTSAIGGYSTAAKYLVPVQYANQDQALSEQWLRVQPISYTGDYDTNEVELDVYITTDRSALRLRRVSGAEVGVHTLNIKVVGESPSYTYSNFSATGEVAPTNTYGSAALTQRNARVGIGTTNPLRTLDVNGTILLQNNQNLSFRDASGNVRRAISYTSGNVLQVGSDTTHVLSLISNTATILRDDGTDLDIDPSAAGGDIIFLTNQVGGNVGIGTATPGAKLDISGSDTSGFQVTNTAAPSSTTGAGISGYTSVIPTAADQRLGFYTLGAKDSGTGRNPVAIQGFSSQAWTSGSALGSYMTLSTTPDGSTTRTEVMRLTSSGNVGIGTTTPSRALDVRGLGNFSGTVYINNGTDIKAYIDSLNTSSGTNNSATYVPYVGANKNTALGIYNLTTTGRIGVGITTPLALLEVGGSAPNTGIPGGNYNALIQGRFGVYGGDNKTIYIDSGGAAGGFELATYDYTNGGVDNLSLQSNGGNVVIANSASKLGIGTSSPASQLSVFQSSGNTPVVNITSSAGGHLLLDTATGTGGFGYLQLYRMGTIKSYFGLDANNNTAILSSSASPLLSVTNAGSVGIGTTTPSRALDVRGVGNFSGTVYINNGTDINTLVSGSDDWNLSSGTLFTKDLDYNVSIGGNTNTGKLSVYTSTTNSGRPLLNVTGYWGDISAPMAIFESSGGGGNDGSILRVRSGDDRSDVELFEVQNVNGTAFVVKGDGKIGIGTNSPSYQLSINGTTPRIGIDRSSGTAAADLIFSQAGSEKALIGLAGTTGSYTAGAVANDLVVRSNAGNILFTTDTGTSTQLYLKNGGNVGINVTAPTSTLQVNGSIRAEKGIWAAQGDANSFGFAAGGNAPLAYSIAAFRTGNDFRIQDDGNFNINTGTTQLLTVYSSGNVSVRAGNLGIGTVSPTQKLHADGGATGLNQGIPATSGTTQNGILRLTAGASNYGETLDFGVNVIGSGQSYGWIQSTNKDGLNTNYLLALNPNGGNVGIGTTSPNQALNVIGKINATSDISLGNNLVFNDTGSAFITQNTANSALYIRTHATGSYMQFETGGTARIRIDNDGEVGIGTTSPTHKLNVVGTGNFTGALTAADFMFPTSAGGSFGSTDGAIKIDANVAAGNVMRFITASTERVRIDGSGNVGIGTSNPTQLLHINSSNTTNANAIILFQRGAVQNGFIGQVDAGQIATEAAKDDVVLRSNSNLILTSGGAPSRLYIASPGGNIGINTTAPNYLLEVNSPTRGLNVSNNLFVNATNVGIGTSNPQAKLEVTGDTSHGIRLVVNTTTTNLRLFNNGLGLGQTNALGIDFTATSGFGPALSAITGGWETSTARGTLALRTSSDSGATLPERLVILGDGNVGIGTTTPNYPLHIQKDYTNATLNIKTNVAAAAGNYGEIAFQTWAGATSGENIFGGSGTSRPSVVLRGLSEDSSARGAFVVATFGAGADNTALTEKFRVTSGGNVGIGTTAPSDKLYINNSDGDAIMAVDRGSNSYGSLLRLRTAGTNDWLVGTRGVSNSDFNIYSYGTALDALTILRSSGNVGIGITTPLSQLHVNGADTSIRVNGSSRGMLIVQTPAKTWQIETGTGGAANGPDGNLVFVESGGGARFIIQNGTGNVGIGTTSPSRALDVRGIGNFSGTVYINNGTDINALVSSSDDWNVSGSNLFPLSLGYNVGIGMAGPPERLGVNGSIWLNGTSAVNGTYKATFPSGTGYFLRLTDSTDSTQYEFGLASISSTNNFLVRNWLATANTAGLQFETGTNGANVMLFSGTGNLGIGTTSPGAKLDVNQSIESAIAVFQSSLVSSESGGHQILLKTNNGNTDQAYGVNRAPAFIIQNLNTTQNVYGALAFMDVGGNSVAGIHGIMHNDTQNNGSLAFFTRPSGGGYTEAVRINPSGYLGIGTTTPSDKLHVYNGASGVSMSGVGAGAILESNTHQYLSLISAANTQQSILFGGGALNDAGIAWEDSSRGNKLEITIPGAGLGSFNLQDSGSNSILYVQNTTRNVGIGTTVPNQKFVVDGTSISASITTAAGAASLLMGNRDSGGANNPSMIQAANGALYFGNGTSWSDANGGTFNSRVVIANTGNVGIGTTGPYSKLSIDINADQAAISNNAANYPIWVRAADENTYQGIIGIGESGTLNAAIGGFDDGTGGAQGLWFATGDNSAISQALTIKSNGNVGIGTTTPGEKLDVLGNITINNTNYYKTRDLTGTLRALAGITSGNVVQVGAIDYTSAGTIFAGGDSSSFTTGGAAGTTRLYIANGGNVGIGTTTPEYKLHSNGTILIQPPSGISQVGLNSTILFKNVALAAASGGTVAAKIEATTTQYVNDGSSKNSLTFSTSTTGNNNAYERVRINDAGNVGINTTSPGAKLHVQGDAIINASATGGNVVIQLG